MRVRTRRIAFSTCTVLALLTSGLWWWSYYESIGIFALPFDTDVRIRRGAIHWRHTYEYSSDSIPAGALRRAPLPVADRRVDSAADSWQGLHGDRSYGVATHLEQLSHVVPRIQLFGAEKGLQLPAFRKKPVEWTI